MHKHIICFYIATVASVVCIVLPSVSNVRQTKFIQPVLSHANETKSLQIWYDLWHDCSRIEMCENMGIDPRMMQLCLTL